MPKLAAIGLAVFWVSMGFMTDDTMLVSVLPGPLVPLIAGVEMDAAGYVTLTRQAGLMREMQGHANNIANADHRLPARGA